MLRKLAAMALIGGLMVGVAAGPVQGKKVRKLPAWGSLDAPLRPGASLGGYCTFNFVFYEPATKSAPAKAYIGTAGHCTEKLDEVAVQPDLGEIGTVVYDSDLVKSTVDFSLIQIEPEFIGQTNPTVLGWGGPTGVVDIETLAIGDQVDVYGYGILLGETEQTRPRYGYLVGWDQKEYQADMPAVNGDSGSPLIHDATGTAFGIISRYGFTVPPSTDLGPLMPWILEELRKAGFEDIELALATE